jgi:DNA-binding transcriptional LysR family regulator
VHVHSRIGQFDLELAGIDAAIDCGDGNWPGLISHHLLDEILVPVISPALAQLHPLNKPSDVAGHILLQVASDSDAWNQWFSMHKLPKKNMRIGPQFEITSHLIQAAVAGIGIGLVPSCLIQDELSSGALQIPIDAPLRTGSSFYLFVPPHKILPPSLKTLKDWLLGLTESQPLH